MVIIFESDDEAIAFYTEAMEKGVDLKNALYVIGKEFIKFKMETEE